MPSGETTSGAESQSQLHRWLCLVLPKAGLDLAKEEIFHKRRHVSTEFTEEEDCSYHHRLHSSQEDAGSTSGQSPSPLSGCLCPRCPRYTGRKPDKDVSTLHLRSFNTTEPSEKLTCLVFAVPKLLIYLSYSFTGGRSKTENVTEKSRSMRRSSSVLRFLEPHRCFPQFIKT